MARHSLRDLFGRLDNYLRPSGWFFVLLFATSCGSWSGEIDSADEAVEVANGFMAENLPQVDLSEMVIETRDLGDRWQVAYDMPGGSTGGPAIFVIEKRSGEIAHVEIGQ